MTMIYNYQLMILSMKRSLLFTPTPSGRPPGADKSSRQAIRTLPSHCKSRLRLMKAIRNPPTAWVPPYHRGRSGTKGQNTRPNLQWVRKACLPPLG